MDLEEKNKIFYFTEISISYIIIIFKIIKLKKGYGSRMRRVCNNMLKYM